MSDTTEKAKGFLVAMLAVFSVMLVASFFFMLAAYTFIEFSTIFIK